jgi:hypothetical protein
MQKLHASTSMAVSWERAGRIVMDNKMMESGHCYRP